MGLFGKIMKAPLKLGNKAVRSVGKAAKTIARAPSRAPGIRNLPGAKSIGRKLGGAR